MPSVRQQLLDGLRKRNMKLNRLNRGGNALDTARLLSAGLLMCAAIAGAACQEPRKAEPTAVSKARPEEKRVLGYFRLVEGTNYLMAPISSRSRGEYGYERDKDAYNYVFFNTADESTLTLLPHNDHLFVATMSLPEKREGDKESYTVHWFLYGLVKSDTDGDEELTYKDRRTLCISDAGGAGFREVITDVEQMYGHSLHDTDTLVVIYRRGSKNYATRINLPSREVVSTKELPTFGVAE